MALLRALRPLTGDYGNVAPGETFEIDEQTAEQLEARGLVERCLERKMRPLLDNKMIVPRFNKVQQK